MGVSTGQAGDSQIPGVGVKLGIPLRCCSDWPALLLLGSSATLISASLSFLSFSLNVDSREWVGNDLNERPSSLGQWASIFDVGAASAVTQPQTSPGTTPPSEQPPRFVSGSPAVLGMTESDTSHFLCERNWCLDDVQASQLCKITHLSRRSPTPAPGPEKRKETEKATPERNRASNEY